MPSSAFSLLASASAPYRDVGDRDVLLLFLLLSFFLLLLLRQRGQIIVHATMEEAAHGRRG